MKRHRLHWLTSVFSACCIALLLAGCGGDSTSTPKSGMHDPTPLPTSPDSSRKSGYLYVSPAGDAANFMQFTEQNGVISGTGTTIYLSTTQSVSSAAPVTYTLYGSHVGDTVTLTFNFSAGSKTDTGTLKDGALTLAVTQRDGSILNVVYQPASIDDYNKAVAKVKQLVANQNQTYTNTMNSVATAQAQGTAQAQAQGAVQTDNDKLTNDLNALQSDTNTLLNQSYDSTLKNYANDWAAMQKDYAAEQQQATQGCGQGNVNYQYTQTDDQYVHTDKQYIQTDDNYLTTDKGYYSQDVTNVETDIAYVNNRWSQLQTDAANNPTHTPSMAFTQDQITQAIANARSAETTAAGTWNTASNKAKGYDTDSTNLLRKADAIPTNMHC